VTQRREKAGSLVGVNVGHPRMVEARQEQQSAPRDRQSTHVIDVRTALSSLPLGFADH
jgi:hypothetical protein